MSLNLTVESVLRPDAVEPVYRMYAAAFEPMRTRAVARHVLTAEDFAGEMADERIEKYVVWTPDGVPVGLGTLATDPAAVPWISPDYFTHRYPEHAARGALFYLGFTLVEPAFERQGIHAMIMEQLFTHSTAVRAVCGVDLSMHSQRERVGRVLATLGQTPGVTLEELDVQTYVVHDFGVEPPTTRMVDEQRYYAVILDGSTPAGG